MPKPIPLTAMRFPGYWDCVVPSLKLGGQYCDCQARETLGPFSPDGREVVSATAQYKTIQFLCAHTSYSDATGFHPGLFDAWSYISSNPALWDSIAWNGYGLLSPISVAPGWFLNPGDSAGYFGIAGTPYGFIGSMWEYSHGENRPGSFGIYTQVAGCVMMVKAPASFGPAYRLWVTSEKGGDTGSYALAGAGSGIVPANGTLIIPLPYGTDPSSPPGPGTPDPTNASNWDSIGVTEFLTWQYA